MPSCQVFLDEVENPIVEKGADVWDIPKNEVIKRIIRQYKFHEESAISN